MESVLEQPVAALPSSAHLDQTSLHLLPCGIHHDGKANIQDYFFLVDGAYPSSINGSSATVSASIAPSMAPETSSSSTESTVVATTETTESTDTITGMTTTTVVSETTSTSTSTTAATTTSVPEVSFRGRTLKGTVIPVPEGYIGTIYKSYDAPAAAHAQKYNRDEDEAMDEDQEYEAMLNGMQEERKALRTKAQFKEFMMWGHDEQPTLRSEKVVRAMQWFDIAKVLHEPLMG